VEEELILRVAVPAAQVAVAWVNRRRAVSSREEEGDSGSTDRS